MGGRSFTLREHEGRQFYGILPDCLITMQRKGGTYGYFIWFPRAAW